MPNFVQAYASTDLNGPQLNGTVGSLTAVLREVLVEGYGAASVSITGITRASQTATATVSAKDMFKLKVGTWITVSGAVETEYNGTFQVATIASATTFTYTVTGTPATPATGTIVFHKRLGITSITRSGTTATVTTTADNRTLFTGDRVTIVGANETDYNVVAAPITVVNTTTFTFVVANSPATPATGTLSYYKPSLGWTKPFENSAATITVFYPQAVTNYGQHYLRVDDSGTMPTAAAKEAVATGFGSMTAHDYGTDAFGYSNMALTSGALYSGVNWRKSSVADTSTREWNIVGDGKVFYIIPNAKIVGPAPNTDSSGRLLLMFGECLSYRPNDTGACLISGNYLSNSDLCTTNGTPTGGIGQGQMNALAGGASWSPGSGAYWARASNGVLVGAAAGNASYGGIGPSGTTANYCHANMANVQSKIPYPHPVDGGLILLSMIGMEWYSGGWGQRAALPGLSHHGHETEPGWHLDRISGVVGLPTGSTIMFFRAGITTTINVGGLWSVDVFGPWV
jgi:hypothetical protein